MNVTIVGAGYVGLTMGCVFARAGHRVMCVDRDPRVIDTLRKGVPHFYEPGLAPLLRSALRARRVSFEESIAKGVAFSTVIFMCVPTPTLPTGAPDLTAVEEVVRSIAEPMRGYRLIVEKSTVPVRTGVKVKQVIQRFVRKGTGFDVASNPEFLREGNAVRDALKPDRIVIGIESRKAESLLRRLYKPFRAPIVVTDIETAELIKHTANAFLALKVSFINAIARICETVGADVTVVSRAVGMDPRIGTRHFQAGIGYGGSCLSKDVKAFQAIAKHLGYDFPMLHETERINHEARERFIRKLEDELWILKGKRAAVLGLAFKPNTDDVRDSVAVEIVRSLCDRGMKIQAYDPKANERAKEALNLRPVQFFRTAYEACKGADCILLLTEWPEFLRLDFRKVRRLARHPILIDGRNALDAVRLRALGFTYRGMGRG